MKRKRIQKGRFWVYVCIDCGTEIDYPQRKYCTRCSNNRQREANRKSYHRWYLQKKGLI